MLKKLWLFTSFFSLQLLPMVPKMPRWSAFFSYSEQYAQNDALLYARSIVKQGTTVKDIFKRDLWQHKKEAFLGCFPASFNRSRAEEIFNARHIRALEVAHESVQYHHDPRVPFEIRGAIVKQAQKRGINNISIFEGKGLVKHAGVGINYTLINTSTVNNCSLQAIQGIIDHELTHICEGDMILDRFLEECAQDFSSQGCSESLNDHGLFSCQPKDLLYRTYNHSGEYVADQLYALEGLEYAYRREAGLKQYCAEISEDNDYETYTHPSLVMRLRSVQAIIACLKEEQRLTGC